jgi:hypothetical protein
LKFLKEKNKNKKLDDFEEEKQKEAFIQFQILEKWNHPESDGRYEIKDELVQ